MKKISVLQYNSMVFLLPITMFFGIGLSNIANDVKESFWVSIIIGIILGSFIVLGFTKIMNKEDNLISSSSKLSSIFYILLSIVFIYIGISILTNLITSIYLTEINPIFLALPLIILLIYSAFKGKIVIARISVIIMIFAIILAGSIILNLIPEVKVNNFLPVFNTSFKTMLITGINYAVYSTSPLLLLSLYSFNEVDNIKKYSLLKSYLLSSIMIIIIFTLTIGVLGIDMVNLYRYPEYIVLKKISYFRFINNIENFNAFFWILTSIELIILSGTYLKESLENLTDNRWVFIGSVVVLFLVIIFTTLNNLNFLLILYKVENYILAGFIIVFFLLNIKKTH